MKEIKRETFLLFTLIGIFLSTIGHAQDAESTSEVKDQYQSDIEFMVQSLQTMLNLLGDPDVSRQDKDEIISQSYLKYFDNEKVQVEDDLDPNRTTPINKDVQSYLQDIVFFYKNIKFDFELQEVSKGLNDKNQVYYKASLKERLEGINLYGEPFNEINDRYIEFNLDEKAQEFKMVSLYTTKLSEKEDIAVWWNELDLGWRYYFANSISLNDSIQFDSLLNVKNDFSINDTIHFDNGDTVYVKGDLIYSSIKSLFALTDVVILPSDSINNLKALSKFTKLENLDFSDCPIDDVSPLRSLLSLRNLNASNSLLTTLDDLQYLSGLQKVNIDNLLIDSLGISENWSDLHSLSMAKSPITDLQFLAKLKSVESLSLQGNESQDYSVISELSKLISLDLSASTFDSVKVLNSLPHLNSLKLNETALKSLNGISDSLKVRIISIENTSITSLKPLVGLEGLKIVYCDNSAITQDSANAFVFERPKVLVVNETEALLTWWEDLNENLKQFIRSRIDTITEPPNRETLHSIIYTERADLAGQASINSLEGFQELVNLKDLDISGTMVSDLRPIASLVQLSNLNISSTPINDVSALSQIEGLNTLNIEETEVSDLDSIIKLPNIELIKANNSGLNQEKALKFTKENGALVLYQNAYLIQWWELLDDKWVHFFSKKLDFNKNPSAEDLQMLVNIDSLRISGFAPISYEPLSEFKLLKTLIMDKVSITDLTILTKLPSLEVLKIHNGPITDYTNLALLTNLKSLDLSNTSLNTLDFLMSYAQLTEIIVAGTAIDNIRSLSAIASLEYVDLSNTKVKKITYLNKLTNLKEVKLTNTLLSPKKIESFKKQRPEVNVIIY